MNNQRGFIQIPILLLIVFGTLVATGGGYYAIKHKSQVVQQNSAIKEENKTATTSNDVATTSGLSFASKMRQVISPKKSEYKSSNLDFRPTALNEKESEPKEDILAIKGKLLEQLTVDSKDFTTLLENLKQDIEQWIKLSEDAADSRAQSLDSLSRGMTIQELQELKQLVDNDANHYRQDKENARSDYSKFYNLVEGRFTTQIQKTNSIKNELFNGEIPSDELLNRVKKLLSENDYEKTTLLSYAPKFNDSFYKTEVSKSDGFLGLIQSIDKVLASYGSAFSVSQKLLEIEQEAQARTLPKTEIHCWADTQYSGGIVNGTSQTSIRCE
jgi:hypothetical protein